MPDRVTGKRTLGAIEALRKTLTSADGADEGSFARAFNAFLDAAEDPAFMEAGDVAKDARIEAAIEATARQISGDPKTAVERLGIMRIPEAGFLHGSFLAAGKMGSFFFFEREEQGLLAFTSFGGMTHFTRITMTVVPQGAVPVRGPRGQQ